MLSFVSVTTQWMNEWKWDWHLQLEEAHKERIYAECPGELRACSLTYMCSAVTGSTHSRSFCLESVSVLCCWRTWCFEYSISILLCLLITNVEMWEWHWVDTLWYRWEKSFIIFFIWEQFLKWNTKITWVI